MTRGVPATLPTSTYHRPNPLQGWAVTAVAEDGSSNGTYDFTRLDGDQELWGPLAVAFAHRVDVDGSWRREATAVDAWTAMAHFIKWLTTNHPKVTTLAALTSTQWREYLLPLPASIVAGRARRVEALMLESGALHPDVADSLGQASKVYKPKVQASITQEQARYLEREALRTVVNMSRRVKRGWELLSAHRAGLLDPDSEDGRWGALLDHVYEHHDVPREPTRAGKRPAATRAIAKLIGSRQSIPVLSRLYMTAEEAAAACAFLALTEAFNPDLIRNLSINDIERTDAQEGTEPAVFRVALDKPRRQSLRFDSANLVESNRHSAAHVLRLILEATAPGRDQLARLGVTEDALVLHLRKGMQAVKPKHLPPLVTTRRVGNATWNRIWYSWLQSLDGDYAGVTLQRLRRYAVTTGRAQGHSEATNANVYRLNDAGVREAQKPIIAKGIQSAYDTGTALVLTTPASKEASIDARLAEAIDTGRLDTPTASCTDYEHSPFDNGRPCTASFLLCFACENAVVVPRLLPRLCYLFDRLDGMRGNVAEEAWLRDYSSHWQRLNHLLERDFTPEERAAARRSLGDSDRLLIDSLLRRRFDA